MNILDIAIAKKLAGGGGGSGTDNYNDLSNLPKINDTTLSGNKSSSALGLQSEINSDSKLASDLVDDTNQDNKFVTSTEKNTWNAKQNAIDADHKINADYVDDSTSTNKFVTASDKETWNAKQNAIDADHKLSSSLVSFSTAEAAALASGIDSSKVGQISTNQTNILYALKTGANNLSPVDNVIFTRPEGAAYTDPISINLSAGDYVIRYKLTTTVNAAVAITYNGSEHVFYDSDAPYSDTVITHNFTVTNSGTSFRFYFNQAATVSELMIVSKEVWDTVGHDFMPPSLPNYDLTRLEAEDRAALAEVVDSGAKNIIDVSSYTDLDNVAISNGVFTTAGDTRTELRLDAVLRKNTTTLLNIVNSLNISTNGVYYWEFTAPANVNEILLGHNGSTYNGRATIPLSLVSGQRYVLQLNVTQATSSAGQFKWQDVMICTKAAFGVSPAFVPYKYPSPTSIALQTESFNVAAANTYYKIFEQFVGGDSVNRLYKIAAAAMYAGTRPAALKVTIQSQTAGSSETIAREITADTDVNYLSTDYIWRSYGGTIRIYASFKAVTNKGAAYLIIDRYKV